MRLMSELTLYEWIQREFILPDRASAVRELAPHLAPWVEPGSRVLDLCCGGGAFAFLLESCGARVTALDGAEFMIRSAREAGRRRGSMVDFQLANVLTYRAGPEVFDAAVLLGNTVADFAPAGLARLVDNLGTALKPDGTFLLHYRDGSDPSLSAEAGGAVVLRESPQRIVRYSKGFLPERSALVEVYINESTGESCDVLSHLYTVSRIRRILSPGFELKEGVSLGSLGFLDVYRKGETSDL